MLWDSVILGLLFIFLAFLSSKLPIDNKTIQLSIFFIPFISFEPLMIFFTGRTIGHRVSGIRVVHKNPDRSLNILQCFIRFIAKSLLGTVSLIMFVFSKNYQAIHDYLSSSLVIFDNEESIPKQRALQAQRNIFIEEKPTFKRRLIVILTLIFLSLLLQVLVLNVGVSSNCLDFNECTSPEEAFITYLGIAMIILPILIIIFGFGCKLPGAYYKPNSLK